jgi:hypothetical protein
MPDVRAVSQAENVSMNSVTIRHIGPEDVEALRCLSAIDSKRQPTGEILVADVGGELWAATSVDDRHTVADPFHPTRELVSLLQQRAGQLRDPGRRRAVRFARLRLA